MHDDQIVARIDECASLIARAKAQCDALRDDLAPYLRGRPVAVLDWPDYPNAGDHLIWLGVKQLLSHLGVAIVGEYGAHETRREMLRDLPDETVLLFIGGGNFGDLYPEVHELRLRVVADHPGKRIVLMPQSVHFRDDAAAAESHKVLAAHPDIRVYARDVSSLQKLRRYEDTPLYKTGIDTAFFLTDAVSALAARFGRSSSLAVELLRRDAERHAGASVDLSQAVDWSEQDDLSSGRGDDLFRLPCLTIPSASCFSGEKDAVSWARLCGAVALFATGSRVVTDRLHGHILACMMGKPHVVYDNSTGKLRDFVGTWFSALPTAPRR